MNMKKSTIFLLVFTLLLGLASPVLADILLQNPLGNITFVGLVCRIVNYVAGLIAGLATLMLVWGGILFVVSAGNEGRLQTAKQILKYAIIGAAVALAGKGLIELIAGIIGASNVGGC